MSNTKFIKHHYDEFGNFTGYEFEIEQEAVPVNIGIRKIWLEEQNSETE